MTEPQPLIALDRATVLVDGELTDPQLNHPEGIAVDRDGSVWCGGTAGEIYRLPADGGALEQVGTTGGYALGLAFDGAGLLYVCDPKLRTVVRFDPRTRTAAPFATVVDGPPMVAPNAVAIDRRRGCAYVSDSNVAGEPGMGVWRIELATGAARLWWDRPLDFANGVALDAAGETLYVAESFGRRVIAIAIGPGGEPAGRRVVVDGLDAVADGLALDRLGRLHIACYAPSQILRVEAGGELTTVIHDRLCTVLCLPTNVAWRGRELLVANYGGHHLTSVPIGVEGLDLLG